MSQPHRYCVVDAFTDRPFAGNPAAVYVLDRWPADDWLRNVAREMNLSETAFITPDSDGFQLRWLTPAVEVDLCGHATLAAAHALWEQGHAKPASEIRFTTRSGLLKAARRGDLIELDFPLTPVQPTEPPTDLLAALGSGATYVGRSRFDYLIEVESAGALRRVSPDFKRLAAIGVRGVIVTSRSDDPQFDFLSRFFAPGSGVDEDPVTGSAHCCLGDYWQKKLGKSEFVAYQASRRGGVVHVRVAGERAFLGGKAVTMARGELLAG